MRQAIKSLLLPRGARTVAIPFGLYRGLRLRIDFATQSQFYFGLYESETDAVIRRALARAAWLIDVGAGDGELSVLFARRGVKTVFAVEPGERRAQIADNMRANDLPAAAITVLPSCIGTGPADVRLDAIAVDRRQPGFVKIDIDGGEVEALRSAEALLASRAASFLVEVHSAALERDCLDLFARAGYRARIIDNAWWRRIIPEQRPLALNRWIAAEPS
jgi:predicted RNA methylase